ncbi:MAG: CAP domain-containing protein [Ruminococcus sp.]|nr:CAP domain-containing protein [Ruminococcus sp.]
MKKRLIQASLPIVSILGGACLLTDVASADDSVVFLETGVLVATETTTPVASGTTTPIASDTTTPVATDTTVMEGWETTDDGNRKYHFSDDTYATGEVQIDNVWYTFDEDGYQKYGWQYVADGWHYYYDTGEAAVSITEVEEEYYLFDYTGEMKTGWRTVNGVRRYYSVDDSGTPVVQIGWIDADGYCYYADEETGEKQIGMQEIGTETYYYFDEYGIQQTDMVTTETGIYYFSPISGEMQVRKLNIGTSVYYFTAEGDIDSGYGTMQTGWQEISGKYYYFNEKTGAAATGLTTIGSQKYYFSGSGTMKTGLVKINGNIYYFYPNGDLTVGLGTMQTGWQTIDDNKYYFDTSGIMQTGWQTIDGKNYYFNKSTGVCQNDAEDTLYKKAVEIYQENMSTYYKEVLTEVNKIRKAAGLSSLILDEDLCIAATMRALEMDENNILSHVRPTSYYNTEGETNYSGDNWYTILYYMNISYFAAGENCASGLSTAASVVAAWESSSGHYANMVNTSYTKIGVGFSADGKVWVQLFT